MKLCFEHKLCEGKLEFGDRSELCLVRRGEGGLRAVGWLPAWVGVELVCLSKPLTKIGGKARQRSAGEAACKEGGEVRACAGKRDLMLRSPLRGGGAALEAAARGGSEGRGCGGGGSCVR